MHGSMRVDTETVFVPSFSHQSDQEADGPLSSDLPAFGFEADGSLSPDLPVPGLAAEHFPELSHVKE